ncbi:O-methyltransferase [Desulfatitalea alkaliphila]|uniref:O-methyltransferase n=1 Tax=Desulfatitalea alkaliphila TaxID=2929485 RepID=A0AA41UL92_9BACT|nr:O-methyltransferase [Desulfatitalea alkaliphila]MCJ8501241.1 O-methyltransferase [Desulfatitalea alkaliphila]
MAPMVNDPHTYFGQWLPRRSALLQELEQEAQKENIPIVGPVVGHLLYLLARLSGARRILELGTATGYSTLFLAQACRHTGGRVVTVESSAAMAERARHNFQQAGLAEYVDLQVGEALSWLQPAEGASSPLDMVFMDIDKAAYAPALPLCAQRLRSGGLLVADNTGFQDAHAFNTLIHGHPDWEMVNLWMFLPGHSPEMDGLCMALRV